MTARADDPEFRTQVDVALVSFVDRQRPLLAELGPDLGELADSALGFVVGGKRLRPQFCYAGWLIAGGSPTDAGFVTAAASLEWLQASALVHDDLMDGSDTRRGRPSIHREYESRHRTEARSGDAAGFGLSTAVLLGDLMLSWCDEMLTRAVLDSPSMVANLSNARRFLDLCKSEVVAGQFLDVVGQTRSSLSVDEAMKVVRYKSAKYTVERPLHIGAALAGAEPELIAGLSEVALPLGEAFQLRDDVLGVFGDPSVTGKPAGDDLREGKRTVLIARTSELTDDAGRTLLHEQLGTAGGIEAVRELIQSSGALAAVEADIARLEDQAESALSALGPEAREILGPLALTATRRTR
ncbi:polyprenyl synthetase family protein [Aeromicrobium sp.]|uniref:polyprenyl synthetase family protein n=1 Tax=Aeromicrobium sp. TaxID=1871063 RepID=UPI002FC91D41